MRLSIKKIERPQLEVYSVWTTLWGVTARKRKTILLSNFFADGVSGKNFPDKQQESHCDTVWLSYTTLIIDKIKFSQMLTPPKVNVSQGSPTSTPDMLCIGP